MAAGICITIGLYDFVLLSRLTLFLVASFFKSKMYDWYWLICAVYFLFLEAAGDDEMFLTPFEWTLPTEPWLGSL